MALPIFTIQSFNQNALQAAGAVFVQRVESVSLLRNVVAEVGGIIGGRSTTMEKKMNDLTKVLLDELQTQTKVKYPSAVALVDVHIEFSDIGKTDQNMFLAGQASATALVRKTRKPENSPVAATVPVPSAGPVPSVGPVSNVPVAPVAPTLPMAPPMATTTGGRRRKAPSRKSKSRTRKH
jgi:uncharacterized protein YbjQ (UPF0145 family)